MGPSHLDFVICVLLLPAIAVGQHVVTVSVGTCLDRGSVSFLGTGTGTGGLGPSALPTGPGVMSNKPETSASESVPSSPSSTPPGFLISYQAPSNSRMRRRDVQMFPTLDGQSTSACIHSPLFNVDPTGQLSVVNAGTSMTYSTSGNVTSAPFAPSSNISSISTTWELAAGTLSWKNSAFNNGTASLCTDAAGIVQAYFLAPIPNDCTPLSLSQTSVYTCPGYFQANPNGQLAPYTPTPILPSSSSSSSASLISSQNISSPSFEFSSISMLSTQIFGSSELALSSTTAATSQSTSSPSSEISSTSTSTSQSTGSSTPGFSNTSVATSQNISSSTLGLSATSVVTSQSTGSSSFVSSSLPSASFTNASSAAGNSSLTPTLPASSAGSAASLFVSNSSTSAASIITSSLPNVSNTTSTSSSISTPSIATFLPGITNSTSTPTIISAPSMTSFSLRNTTFPTTPLSSSNNFSSSSSGSVSASASSSSVPTSSVAGPSSGPGASPSNSTFLQVTMTKRQWRERDCFTTHMEQCIRPAVSFLRIMPQPLAEPERSATWLPY